MARRMQVLYRLRALERPPWIALLGAGGQLVGRERQREGEGKEKLQVWTAEGVAVEIEILGEGCVGT